MSGWRRSETGWKKSWMTVRRNLVMRIWKVLNTQHRTKELFRDAWSLPNEHCDGTRSSWGGLSDNELKWIHGLLHLSKTLMIRKPHWMPYRESPLVSVSRGNQTFLRSGARLGCRNPRRRIETCGLRHSRLQKPSLSLWTRMSRHRTAFNKCRSVKRKSLHMPKTNNLAHLANFVHRECPSQIALLLPARNHGQEYDATATSKLKTKPDLSAEMKKYQGH